jgi:hypothetical protein
MVKISKDTPLFEVNLRKYEKPVGLSQRELVRKLCLSLGVLQPGDSRDVIVDILYVFLKNKEKQMTSKEIEEKTIIVRKQFKQQLLGIAPSNIRRQILRLRDIFLIEKIGNEYRIKENSKFLELFVENIEKYYLKSILERVKDYLKVVDKEFEL